MRVAMRGPYCGGVPAISGPNPCPECGYDSHTVSPGDAVVALRSYSKRYRALLSGMDENDAAVSLEKTPSGWSAADHAVHLADLYELSGVAIERITTSDGAAVDLEPPAPNATNLDEVLVHLSKAASGLATTIDNVKGGKSWKRTGQAGGTSVTALQVVQHAVHEGVHHLKEAQHAIDEARGHSSHH